MEAEQGDGQQRRNTGSPEENHGWVASIWVSLIRTKAPARVQPARNSYNTLLRPNLNPAVKTLAMREMLPLDTSDKLHLVNMAASQLGKKGSATVC